MKVRGVGVCSLEGPTHANEDRFVQFCGDEAWALTSSSSSPSPLSSSPSSSSTASPSPGFFAVYDGHAGDLAVTHVAKALHAHIFSPSNHSLFFPSAGDAEPGPTLMEEAILHGFAKTEEEVLAINERRDDISGACAVAVVHQGDRLYVANLGDSRALIGRKKVKGSIIGRLTLAKASRVEEIETRERKKRVNLRSFLKSLTQDKIRCTAVPLTRDLKAVASYERQRIIAAGGWIRRGRVFGVLAPSRSFGDPLEKGRMRGRKMRRGTVKGGEGRKVEEEERKAAEEAERKAAEQQAQEGGDGGASKEGEGEGEGDGGEEEATSNEKVKRKKESNEGSDEGEDEKPDDNDDESEETASPAMPARAVGGVDSTPPQKEKEKDEKEGGVEKTEAEKTEVEADQKGARDNGHSNGATSNGNGSGGGSVGRVVPNAAVSKEKTTGSGTTTPTTKRAAKNNGKGKNNKKKSKSEMKKLKGVREGVVIAVPEMTVHTLAPEDDFLVLATDGLWDVMDNKMVVDHVSPEVLKWRRLKDEEEREKAQEGGQSEGQRELNELRQSAADFLDNICRGLCKRAKRRGSRDDITVVIVIFDPLATERSE